MAATLWGILLIGSTLYKASDALVTAAEQTAHGGDAASAKPNVDAPTQKANVLHRAKSFHRKFAGRATEGKPWRDINDCVTEFFTFDPSSGRDLFCFTGGRCELVIKKRSTQASQID